MNQNYIKKTSEHTEETFKSSLKVSFIVLSLIYAVHSVFTILYCVFVYNSKDTLPLIFFILSIVTGLPHFFGYIAVRHNLAKKLYYFPIQDEFNKVFLLFKKTSMMYNSIIILFYIAEFIIIASSKHPFGLVFVCIFLSGATAMLLTSCFSLRKFRKGKISFKDYDPFNLMDD